MYTVVIGSTLDRIKVFGPFPSEGAANDWGRATFDDDQEWTVTRIYSSDEF